MAYVVLIILSYMFTGNPRVLSTKPGLDNGSELDMNTHFSDLVSPGPAVNRYYQSEFFVRTQHTPAPDSKNKIATLEETS